MCCAYSVMLVTGVWPFVLSSFFPSPHVVKYYGSYFKNTDLWIVMEYCGAGSVSDIIRLRNKTVRPFSFGWKYGCPVAQGSWVVRAWFSVHCLTQPLALTWDAGPLFLCKWENWLHWVLVIWIIELVEQVLMYWLFWKCRLIPSKTLLCLALVIAG